MKGQNPNPGVKQTPEAPKKMSETTAASETASKKPSKQYAFAMKKADMIKIALVVVAIIVAIPVLDALIQFSITGRYAAFVGKSQVTRSEYTQELEKQYGSSVIQGLVVEKLIENQVAEKKISIDENKVNDEITNIKKQFSSDQEFNNALTSEKLTVDDLKRNIRIRMGLDEIIKPTLTTPSDADIKAYYDQNKDKYASAKNFDEAKPTVIQDLQAAMLSQKRNDWISQQYTAFNKDNDLTIEKNSQYQFLNSVSLIKKLIGWN